MNKLKFLPKLTIAGVASVTAMLSVSSAQAVVFFEGTLGDWADLGTISAGDKDFIYGDSDLDFEDTLIIETAGLGNLDYLVNVNLVGTDTTVSSFFLDYDVVVTDPGFQITAVDLDSTVDVFEPDEVLTTTYNSTTLTSIGGSPELDALVPPSMMVAVSNTYTTPEGGEISAFENSFQQRPKTPEPGTILGLLAVGGLGLGLKRKKQS